MASKKPKKSKMKPPKGFLRFFNPASDEHFKKKHPVGYVFLVILGLFAFLLPLLTLMVVILNTNAPASAWMVLAFIGCLVMGVGLFNLVAIIIKQYLGHLLTIICLLGGGALIAIACVFTYAPALNGLFDEDITTFFFVTNIFYAFMAIFYVMFRGGVRNHLERKGIKAGGKMKGAKRFWFYSELRKSNKIGFAYTINLIFIILYVALGTLILLGGYFEIMQIPISVAFSLCALVLITMNLFEMIEGNLDKYHKPIIFLRRSSNGGIDFIIFQLVTALIPCVVAYAQWRLIF